MPKQEQQGKKQQKNLLRNFHNILKTFFCVFFSDRIK